MAGLILREAVQADHASLEALFRATSMGSRIRIGVERGPDYFVGARIQADEPCVWAAFEEKGQAVGLFSAGRRDVWLDSGPASVRYLSDLRIHPDWQRSSLLARGFRLLRGRVFEPGEWAQTLVLDGNVRAVELLTSGRAGLPEYRAAGRYLSWLLPKQGLSFDSAIRARRAVADDLEEMQSLLDASSRRRSFAPVLRLADLGGPSWRDLTIDDFLVAERNGMIRGMMGLWDQSGFQELRIDGYAPVIERLRPCWNGWVKLSGGIPLPRPGERLSMKKATALACLDDDPGILRAMLAVALSERDGRLLLIGMSAMDPLVKAMKGMRGRKESGQHFLVGWDGSPPAWREPFGFDVARI